MNESLGQIMEIEYIIDPDYVWDCTIDFFMFRHTYQQ